MALFPMVTGGGSTMMFSAESSDYSSGAASLWFPISRLSGKSTIILTTLDQSSGATASALQLSFAKADYTTTSTSKNLVIGSNSIPSIPSDAAYGRIYLYVTGGTYKRILLQVDIS